MLYYLKLHFIFSTIREVPRFGTLSNLISVCFVLGLNMLVSQQEKESVPHSLIHVSFVLISVSEGNKTSSKHSDSIIFSHASGRMPVLFSRSIRDFGPD